VAQEETGLKSVLISPASADHLELSEKMSLAAGSEKRWLVLSRIT